jgi:hypothetical protein
LPELLPCPPCQRPQAWRSVRDSRHGGPSYAACGYHLCTCCGNDASGFQQGMVLVLVTPLLVHPHAIFGVLHATAHL